MAWIEAHQELRNHPKTKKAARLLGISRPQMIGHLFCLWWWCLDYSANGNLSAFDNADIADGAEWEGDPDRFVHSLIDCGPSNRPGFLVDNGAGLEVKDWSEYGGKYITKRDQGRERQRNFRTKKRQSNADVTGGNVSVTDSNALVTRYNGVSNAPIYDMSTVQESTEEDKHQIESSLIKGVEAPPMAATPPKPKPETAKTPKAAKPPTEPPPPAIQALREIVGIYPPKETWDLLVAACRGKTKTELAAVHAEFLLRTPNKHNWSWVTDGVRSYSGKPNGKSNGTPVPTQPTKPLTEEEEYAKLSPEHKRQVDSLRAAERARAAREGSKPNQGRPSAVGLVVAS